MEKEDFERISDDQQRAYEPEPDPNLVHMSRFVVGCIVAAVIAFSVIFGSAIYNNPMLLLGLVGLVALLAAMYGAGFLIEKAIIWYQNRE